MTNIAFQHIKGKTLYTAIYHEFSFWNPENDNF